MESSRGAALTPSLEAVTILIVDDEEAILAALRKFLAQRGMDVITATNGDEALKLLHRHKVTCMLLDVHMPGISGVDLVPAVMEAEPNIALLMLTAVNDATSAALCMQRGAMDYLTKPIDLDDLSRAIERALQKRHARMEDQRMNHWLKEEVALRSTELRLERANLERISIATLEALVNALEAKDPYLRGHSARVADLSASVAAEMGVSDEEVERVRTAGRLHDIGKIGIREDILNKQGPLSNDEYDHIKQHVVVGSQILSPLMHLTDVIGYVRNHHERWDGMGYPDRLSGTNIPYGARVIGAVEIFDALTSARPYQERMMPEEAVERMAELSGRVVDPDIYQALATVVARRQTLIFLDDSGR
jgi:putative nucleotidyltransferase with HDIG domain